MSLLVEYFVADSADIALEALKDGPARSGMTYVDCTGWTEGLLTLAAELTGRRRGEFGVETTVVDWGESGLSRVPDDVVVALAAIDEHRALAHAEEEVLDEAESRRNRELLALARAAVRGDKAVYFWWSL